MKRIYLLPLAVSALVPLTLFTVLGLFPSVDPLFESATFHVVVISVIAGCALAVDGRSDQAIDHIEQAIRMSPHDPQNALFNVHLAAAHYVAGRYTEAVNCGRKAMQQRFGLTNGHRVYIASLAQAGQIDEARAALARLQELQPENSIAWIEDNIPYTAAPMAKFIEGMRKAGLQ